MLCAEMQTTAHCVLTSDHQDRVKPDTYLFESVRVPVSACEQHFVLAKSVPHNVQYEATS